MQVILEQVCVLGRHVEESPFQCQMDIAVDRQPGLKRPKALGESRVALLDSRESIRRTDA